MPFEFSDAVIETRKGPRSALVITPDARHQIGRERLVALRRATAQDPIDAGLLEAVRSRENPRVVIFRCASDDGAGWWGLADSLSPDERAELARLLTLSHLPTWRHFVRQGVWMMAHIDMKDGPTFRTEARLLAEEMENGVPPTRLGEPGRSGTNLRLSGGTDAEIRRIDAWLLKNLVFYFAQPLAKVLEGVLPDKLPLIETRRHRLEAFAQTIAQVESVD